MSCAIALALLGATLGACGAETKDRVTIEQSPAPKELTAGTWKPWVLASGFELIVPPPPPEGSVRARADLNEVESLAKKRTPAVQRAVKKWSDPLATRPWTELAFDFVSQEAKDPPLSSRNYALVHVAMYDAVISAWHWKYEYNVKPPQDVETLVPVGRDPSYPSEHAAMAGAASRVLAFLYPRQSALRLDEMADQAAGSRVQAGTNTPSDVNAGLQLGRQVADKVIAYAKTDRSDTKWDGARPARIGGGPEYWEPAPGVVSPPIAPVAGSWKPWLMTSGSQFRPGPPPAYGTAEFRAAAQEIFDIKNNLTAEQKKIAKFWEGAEGTSLPAGIALKVAMKDIARAATASGDENFTLPEVARAMALINIAMADGGIAAWDAKYTYWNPRPENAIRDLGIDPNWEPYLPSPRFPAYPSGSAGYAGTVETVMTYLFPDNAAEFKRRAEEQAVSRLYAGIHWRYDAISMEAGRKIGQLVVDRAKQDGADA